MRSLASRTPASASRRSARSASRARRRLRELELRAREAREGTRGRARRARRRAARGVRERARGGDQAAAEPGGPGDLRADARVLRLPRPGPRRAHRQHPRQARAPRAGAREDRRRARAPRRNSRPARSARWPRCAQRRTSGRRPWRASTARSSRAAASCRALESQARGLEKLIADLRKALRDVPVAKQAPFEPLKGKLPWPVQQGRVLARFGQPRAGGSMRWQGMLIGTDRGARVRAPFAGRVAYADWLPGMGLMIVLDHGGGYMSLYGHNEEAVPQGRRPGGGRRRDRLRRRHRRAQPAGAVFRGPARPPAGRPGDLAAAPIAVGIMFNAGHASLARPSARPPD